MANFDYFKQYVDRLEHIKAITAHEEHIMEFKAMCADMIKEATPAIKEECMREMKAMLPQEPQKQDVQVRLNMKDIKKQIFDAFKKAFK